MCSDCEASGLTRSGLMRSDCISLPPPPPPLGDLGQLDFSCFDLGVTSRAVFVTLA